MNSGKRPRKRHSKNQVGDFFWKVICQSEQYKDELVSNCITKFCEMILQWDPQQEIPIFGVVNQELGVKTVFHPFPQTIQRIGEGSLRHYCGEGDIE